jgi:hypothetical protein
MVSRKTTLAVLLGVVAIAGISGVTALAAEAQPPVTGTEVSKTSETFSDEPFLCQDELYTISGNGPRGRALHLLRGLRSAAVPPARTRSGRGGPPRWNRSDLHGDLSV